MWVIPLVMVLMMALMFFGPGRTMHGPGHSGAERSPSEILTRRFARGVITKDQYEEMQKALREHAEPPTRGND
jgi:putative membrane protein